ncbi:MAG TPA: tRNA lysidine(34) synthetase TilS [Atribacteraceae bacterium]|nr:tRNA lysidine(34) synthetase TilS [Atribacteraceae bacterium]
MHSLVKNVENHIRTHGLISPGSNVLAAFSGGPDSTAMTHILYVLQETLQFHLSVCHLNHQLRGAESDRDEEFVKQWACEKQIPCYIARQDVRLIRRSEKRSLEEAARFVRYRYFNEIAQAVGAERIALGHHFDDQVENVLIRLTRGSGLRGLAGMRPRSGIYIRPLLCFRKKAILDFLVAERLAFVEDVTNQDPAFLRNRIRQLLLPLLEKDYNPRIREALWRLSLNIQEHLEKESLPIRSTVRRDGLFAYPLFRLASLSRSELIQEILWCVERICGDSTGLSRYHVAGLVKMVREEHGEMNLPGKVKVWIDSYHLIGSRNPVLLTDLPPWEYPLCFPGENWLREAGIFLNFEVAPVLSKPIKGDWVVLVDKEFIKPPCIVRNFRPGDRVMTGGRVKKIKEVFSDLGLPREWRSRVPILCDRENILWIPGVVLDERMQVGENSKSLLRIQAGKRTR